LGESEISVAKILFSKKIPFCIYRFPGKKNFHLAIDAAFVEPKERKTLWFSPFDPSGINKEIFFCVLNEDELTSSFISELQVKPLQQKAVAELPEETTKENYFRNFKKFLQDIESGELKKAVLSRVIYQDKPTDFHPVEFFLKLATDYSDAFVHLSQHPDSGMWIGATPELLIQKSSTQLHIMALAGTQARHHSATPYLWRQKEEDEHLMVSEHVETILQQFDCTILNKIGPYTIEAAQVAHLRTDYTAEGKNVDIKTFLKKLHPTPAVGGLPVEKGLECIRKFEGYNRSYYCGFIGETDFKDDAHLFINLRCLQVGADKLAVYAGGGITAASNAEAEWNETILKSKTMTNKLLTQTPLKHGIVG